MSEFVADPIPYVRDIDVVYGRSDQLSPLVRRVIAENPNKFTYRGTGTYLVGRGDVAVIDPGPALTAHIAAVVGALEPDERVSAIVITHTHSDHSPGARLLQELTDAPTYGFGPHGPIPPDDPTDVVLFNDDAADGTKRGDGVEKSVGRDELREGADTDFVPDVLLADGQEIGGGTGTSGWTLRALHTPGHTSNHLCYELPEEHTVFSGDHVMGWSTTVIGPPDGDLRQYVDSLNRLIGRGYERLIPTHGPVVTNPDALVRAYVEHRAERTAQIIEMLRAGPSTIAEMVPVIYAAVDKSLWRPAAVSMYAHLLALVDMGLVSADGALTADGSVRRTARYRLLS